MISREEKVKRQRKIIDELYENLHKSKPTSKSYIDDFFLVKLKEVFIAEMEYYGLKTCQKKWKDDDIHFEKKSDPKSRFAAEFCHATRFGLDDKPYHQTPSVKVNVACGDYDLLLSDDPYYRRIACRFILKQLSHEVGHFRQYKMILSGRSSYYTLLCAMEMLLTSREDDWYTLNHDRFSYEADADYFAFGFENSIGKPNGFSIYGIPIKNGEMLTSNLIIPRVGYIDRDTFLFAYIDMLLHRSNKAYKAISSLPILGKAYNLDGSFKRLTELMSNHQKELDEVKNMDIDEGKKKDLIDDINSLYFELYNKKIQEENRFEIYEAIYNHSYTTFMRMLAKLKVYNQSTKRLKLDAIKKKRDALEEQDMPFEIFNDNKGYIIDPKNEDNGLMSAEELIKAIPLKDASPSITNFIHSAKFINTVPIFGYYLLPSGEKLSVKDFINEYLIPLLPKEGSIDECYGELFEIAAGFVQPVYNQEEQFNLEKTNRQYQLIGNSIKECEEAIRENGIGLTSEKYDFTIIQSMELLKDVIDYDDKELLDIFNAQIVQTPHGSYKDFSDEQIGLYNSLKLAAQILTTDKFFNPDGINYYNKMCANGYFSSLDTDMQVCMRIKSTVNPSL